MKMYTIHGVYYTPSITVCLWGHNYYRYYRTGEDWDMQKNFFSGMAYSIFVHNGKGWLGIANRR
jgi:hypothetical protein